MTRRSSSSVWWIAVALVVAVGIAVIVAVSTSSPPSSSGIEQYGTPEVAGEPLPPIPDDPAARNPAVGMAAPRVSGTDARGDSVALPVGAAHVVVFGAHWCPHCNRELPMIGGLLRSGQLGNVPATLVLTGSQPNFPNWPPTRWAIKTMRWPASTLMDSKDDDVARAYGVGSYPAFVFVRADGTVAARYVGEIPASTFAAGVKAAGIDTGR